MNPNTYLNQISLNELIDALSYYDDKAWLEDYLNPSQEFDIECERFLSEFDSEMHKLIQNVGA